MNKIYRVMYAICAVICVVGTAILMLGGGIDGNCAEPTHKFTRGDVIKIWSAAAARLNNKEGTLAKEVNTAKHSNFPWSWDTHYLHIYFKGRNFSVRVHNSNLSKGYSYIEYVFIDENYDGIVDSCFRRHIIVCDDIGSIVVLVPPEDNLRDAMNNWALNVPDAQERYEKELTFWWNELGLQ